MQNRRYKYNKKAGALQEAIDQEADGIPLPQSFGAPGAANAPAGNYAGLSEAAPMQRQMPAAPKLSMARSRSVGVQSLSAELGDALHDRIAEEEDLLVDGDFHRNTLQSFQRMEGARSHSAGRLSDAKTSPASGSRDASGRVVGSGSGAKSMFFYTVEDGQRVLVVSRDGKMRVVDGPARVFRWWRKIRPVARYVAHPGEFLIVRYRDGRQEHIAGPANVWMDPRKHLSIDKEEALPIAAKEAVVVYSEEEDGEVSRRIVYGPATFIPKPGEWLHTFSWHGSKPGAKGYVKVPNALTFQKLWMMPDQMYHDVTDVRTEDDALLTIRLMLFFELIDIERMLETSHDPIGDFINAATSDIIEFVSKHEFEVFKRNTEKLNELSTYKQLTSRADSCGYRINKVVYRGYGAPANLQQMHDQAIESRTRLQLERATEQQAQELQDFKLERDLLRNDKERGEETAQIEHSIEMERKKQQAQLESATARKAFEREQRESDAALQRKLSEDELNQQREHFASLKEMGVDMTSYLTQHRADRVIELRGGGNSQAHLHLEQD